MRIIGNRNWSEVELDPVAAYRRARALDSALRSTFRTLQRGVYRGTFKYFAQLDRARELVAAARINRQ